MYPEADPTRLRECEKQDHAAPEDKPPSAPPASTTTATDEGADAAKAITNAITSSPVLSDIFGNERMNIYILGMGEYYVVVNEGEIVEEGEGELPDQTMNVYTDVHTVQMLESKKISPLGAIKKDLIIYEGVGFVEGIKFWIADFLVDWFVVYEESATTGEPEPSGNADVLI